MNPNVYSYEIGDKTYYFAIILEESDLASIFPPKEIQPEETPEQVP